MESLEVRFGIILKELRTKRGFTQAGLATDCGLDRTYTSRLERGSRQPTLTTLFKIAEILEVSPSSIIKELEK